MSDDLDDVDEVLRRAMATLDRQAPEGYFDALPERTLARLDDPDALDELARERAARGARGHPPAHASPNESAPERPAEGATAAPPAAAEAPDAAARRRPRRAIVAIGAGLAAAAVALLFVSMETRTARSPAKRRDILATSRDESRGQVATVPAMRELPQAAESTLSQAPPAAPAPHPSSAAVSDPMASEQLGTVAPDVPAQRDGRDPPTAPSAAASSRPSSTGRVAPPPSINHFSHAAAPAPSAQDVELAMRALTDRFAACLDGARGKAIVEATFRPSGELSAAALAAPLAGTPAEACVRRVLGDVRFPSWTGSPETFRFTLAVPEVRSIPSSGSSDGPL